MNPWIVVAAIFFLNLPFGAWRASVRKFSPAWFVAIHAPVIMAIVLRLATGAGFHPVAFLESVAAFGLGQFTGGWLLRRYRSRPVRVRRVPPISPRRKEISL